MNDDQPYVGWVIRHWYLWHRERRQGAEEGRKPRPCVVVRVTEESAGSRVFVAPITTQTPKLRDIAKEIPVQTQNRLGLGGKQSWVILDELNSFIWRGPDLEPTATGSVGYGNLPPRFTKAVVSEIQALARERRVRAVSRDEKPKPTPTRGRGRSR